MTKNISTWILAALLSLSLATIGACSKKEEKKDDGANKKAKPTLPTPNVKKQPATPTPPTGPEIADEDLPVETDFEEEAEKDITAENYKSILDELEKEISAE